MRTVGVVVNPIAGMGGRVGLKGTDGKVAEARALGAEPRAPDRARAALTSLAEHGEVTVLTWGEPMGADLLADSELWFTVLGEPATGDTDATDTAAAVGALAEAGVDLILFVGGDGTAVDVAEALQDAPDPVPVLGVPAGVKVFSEVFATTPPEAGRIAATFEETEAAEINDLDEAAYRRGEVRTTPRGVVRVPVDAERQASKQLAGGSTAGLVAGLDEEIRARPDTTYVFGPGGTVGDIEAALGIDPSPLGVDVYRDGTLLARDASEEEILANLGDTNEIVVSPVGGQGFLFGRGNLQISPAVIQRADAIQIVASRRKLDDIGVLRVDTGDADLDADLRGWHRVRIGRVEERMIEVR